jgi:glutathione S-transferase
MHMASIRRPTTSGPVVSGDRAMPYDRAITLFTFGPFLGAPDSSPFVMKVMVLLKLAGLAFHQRRGNPMRAPHGFLPYIEDGSATIADSNFIRRYIEEQYGVDFDAALSVEEKAVAWSVERMCEDHLYFAMLDARWRDRANFARGLGRYMFGAVPAPLRPIVKAVLRRRNAARLIGHGIGRHDSAAIAELGIRDLHALAAVLGDRPYLTGGEPCGADATMFGMIAALLTPELDSPLVATALRQANLVAYRDRMMERFFPELAKR